jgi:hypothetical protein
MTILRVKDDTRRQNLFKGKVAIIGCFSKLPKTQHDPHLFAVDLTLFRVSLGYMLLD